MAGKRIDEKASATITAPDKKQDVETQTGDGPRHLFWPAQRKKCGDEEVDDPEKQRQIYLLRARALSMKKNLMKLWLFGECVDRCRSCAWYARLRKMEDAVLY